jgi:hypothetical protein
MGARLHVVRELVSVNPFLRPGESAQKGGFRFETFWAKIFGVEPTRGSGSQWFAKMDVGDGSVLWSLKHSARDLLRFGRYRMTDLMKECESAINGPGGVGGSTVPGVAIHEQETGETFVCFRAADFQRMAQTGEYAYIVPSKGEQKRIRSRLPALLREDDDG